MIPPMAIRPPRRLLAVAAAAVCTAGCATAEAARRPAKAPVPAEPPAAQSCRQKTTRIAAGETLYRIARRYGVSVAELERENGITDPRAVPAGTLLRIPCARGSSTARANAEGVIADADFVMADEPAESPWDSGKPATADARGSDAGGWCPVTDSPDWIWPLAAGVSSRFGQRHGRLHAGVDLRAKQETPVHCPLCGVVASVRTGTRGYGTVVTVDHGGGTISLYAHLLRAMVHDGDHVAPGDVIGLVGSTGNATAPHLHFEIRRNGAPIDPLQLLPAASATTGALLSPAGR